MNKEITILRTLRKGIAIEVIENEVSGVKWNIDTIEHDKQIRIKAIDEFLSKAKEKKYHSDITHENCVAIAELDWIAEKLKGE